MTVQPVIAYRGTPLPAGTRGRRNVQLVLAAFGMSALGALCLLGGAGRALAMLLGGVAAAGLTLYDIRIGLGIFLLLAGLSPEFSVESVATVDNLRAEDFLFPVLLASWFTRCNLVASVSLWYSGGRREVRLEWERNEPTCMLPAQRRCRGRLTPSTPCRRMSSANW